MTQGCATTTTGSEAAHATGSQPGAFAAMTGRPR